MELNLEFGLRKECFQADSWMILAKKFTEKGDNNAGLSENWLNFEFKASSAHKWSHLKSDFFFYKNGRFQDGLQQEMLRICIREMKEGEIKLTKKRL